MRHAPLIVGFALLGVGVITDDLKWSYAGLAVFALGAVVMFAYAWKIRHLGGQR